MDEWGLPRAIPISGTWSVTYGAPARVEISGSMTHLSIRAATRIQLRGSQHSLPSGTLLGQLRQATPTSYYGEHGLWFVATGQFARWAQINLTLYGGNQLTGTITNNGAEPITFTRLTSISTAW